MGRRALLIYNFALAAILLVAATLSTYAVQVTMQSSQVTDMPTFDAETRAALDKQPDLEQLRARALFYFDLARELKRARGVETLQLIYDARRLALIAAGLFFLSGILTLVLVPAGAAATKPG